MSPLTVATIASDAKALAQPAPIDVNQAVKAQIVRVADVVVIGPLMIAGGASLAKSGHGVWGTLLGLFGVGTILFNGYNWVRVRKALDTAAP